MFQQALLVSFQKFYLRKKRYHALCLTLRTEETGEMKRNVRFGLTFFLPLVLVAALAILILLHVSDARTGTAALTNNVLHSSVSAQRDLLSVHLDGEFALLNALSASVQTEETLLSPETALLMKKAAASSDFSELILTNRSGSGITAEGRSVSIGDSDYFLCALNGEKGVRFLDPTSEKSGGGFVAVSVPVQAVGNPIAVRTGWLDKALLRELLSRNVSDGGVTVLCDDTGRILLDSAASGAMEGGNLFSILQTAQGAGQDSLENMMQDIREGNEGYAGYSLDGKQLLAAYVPLGYEGWVVCTSVPAEDMEFFAETERQEKLLFIGVSLASALLLTLVITTLNSRVTQKSRREHRRLMSKEEEYRISAQQNGLVILRYDTENEKLISSQGAIDHFRFPDEYVGREFCGAFDSIVTPESREDLAAFRQAMQAGEPSGRAEISLLNAEGLPGWYAFEFSAIGDGGGGSTQAIVTIRDITTQHERMAAYQRWQSLLAASDGTFDAMLEINLSSGMVEGAEGEFLEFIDPAAENCRAEDVLGHFERRMIDEKDRKRFAAFISYTRLIDLAERGVMRDEAEIRLSRPDGTVRWCLAAVQATFNLQTSEGKALITLKDMDDSRLEMERLSDLALHDGLTGLLNRTAARNEIEERLRFGPGGRVALFMIDADNFKLINDTLGHQHGDRALRQMAQAIRSVFRASDLIARIGGDEFFVFLPEVPADDFAESKAGALCSALRLSYSLEERGAVMLTASIGVVVAEREKVNFETLYAEADHALYDAKNAGKNRYSIRYTSRPGRSRTCQPAQPDGAFQLQSLMKHLDGGVVIAQIGEHISLLFASDGYFHRMGVMDEAAKNGTFPISNIHPLDYGYVKEAVAKCAQDGESFQIIYRNVLADGGYGWRHLYAARIPNQQGDLPAIVGVISDITELKNATERFEAIARRTQIGILILRVGERLEITFFNDGALTISGFNYEQMRLFSRDAAAMFRGGNLEGFRAAVARAIEGNEPLEYVYQSGGFAGRSAHAILLHGVKLDVQNGVPSFLILMAEHDEPDGADRRDR
jgi:diguanylate cyclase (GGDEF)-like protein/PAS domain S-box-containing protein